MDIKKRVFIKIKSVFRENNFFQKNFYRGDYFFSKKHSTGFISSYILISLAISTGLLGGFFLGRTDFSEKKELLRSPSGVIRTNSPTSSEKIQSASLLGSISEVFSRALGKNPENLIAEVDLESRASSSFDFEFENNATATSLFSSTTILKNKTTETNNKKISACTSSSVSISSREIIFNEIAWMGSPAKNTEDISLSSRREWIELLNISSRTISVANWQIQDQAGKFHIIFPASASIPANRFFLLARSGADKIMNKNPDLIYGTTLSNDGAHLKIFNDECKVVDEIDAQKKWPAGNRETRQTLERDSDHLGWHTSVSPGGTPRAENSIIKTTSVPVSSSGGGPGTVASPTTNSSSVASIIYPKILISEVQTASESSTRDEFLELYNPNQGVVDLTGWYVQKRTKSGTSLTTFLPKGSFEGKIISGNGFLVIAHPSSSLEADLATDEGLADHNTLILKNPNGDIVDKVGWGEAGDFEGHGAAPNPSPGESIQRRAVNNVFSDTESNINDFEVRDCPSPKLFLEVCSSLAILPPANSEETTETSTLLLASSSDVASSTTTTTENVIGALTSTETVASSTVESGESSIATSTTETSSSSVSSTIISSPLNHLVIMEVQITDGTGKTDNDYIKIFNPTDQAVDVSNWKLRKRTQSGSETSIKVFPDGSVIASNENFIWANSKDGFSEVVGAHVSSTQTLASNNSIALLNNVDVVIDAVAWGSNHENPFVEGIALIENPESGKVLRRKIIEEVVVDTDSNSADFSMEIK